MAGKSRKDKKKRAKIRKREHEFLAQKSKKEKTIEPAPEDLLRQQQETEELTHAKEQGESEAEALGNNGEPIPKGIDEDAGKEPTPFDPASVVANILKKRV